MMYSNTCLCPSAYLPAYVPVSHSNYYIVYLSIYTYIYVHVYVCIHIYIYMCVYVYVGDSKNQGPNSPPNGRALILSHMETHKKDPVYRSIHTHVYIYICIDRYVVHPQICI